MVECESPALVEFVMRLTKFENALSALLFAPLRMEHTGIWDDSRIITNHASSYDPWIDAAGLIDTPFYDKSVLVESGSLYSTLTTYALGTRQFTLAASCESTRCLVLMAGALAKDSCET